MDHQAMESLSRRRALGVAAVAAAAMIGSEALKAQPALAVQGRRAGECNPDTQTGEGGVLPYAAPKTASYDSRVASAKRLLVVVDYQNDFIYGSAAMGDIAANIEGAICKVIEDYQRAGDIVIYTMDTHPSDGYQFTREGHVNVPHCDPETDGWKLYGKVADLLTEERGAIQVRKGTIGSMDLPFVVQSIIDNGTMIKSIELCGTSTTCRVLHNAIILYNCFPEVEMIMDRTTTTSYTEEMTEEVLRRMESWGFVVKW